MINGVKYCSFFLLFLNTIFITHNHLQAQTYADKSYYLIDSLDLKILSSHERKLIDSSLIVFHKSKHDTLKLEVINALTVQLINEKVWPKYNDWVYEFATKKLEEIRKTSKRKTSKKPLETRLLNFKALSLNNKGFICKNRSDYDKALRFYLKSLALLEIINDRSGIAVAMNNIGHVYMKKGEIANALEYYQKSLKIKEELQDKKGIANTLNNIGIIYRNTGDIAKAIEYYFKSLALLEELGDENRIAVLLNNIGIIYQNRGDTLKAIEFYRRSLKIKQKNQDKRGEAIALNKLGSIYSSKEDMPEALSYYKKGLKINKEINDKDGIASSIHNIGYLYYKKGDMISALSHYQESLRIREEIGNKDDITSSLNSIAQVYLKQGELKKAKNSANRSMELAQELGFPSKIKNAAAVLNEIYVLEKNWKEAYKMKQLHASMNDSLRSLETENNIIKQQAKYALEKKEKEIALLSAKNEVQKLTLNKNRILVAFFSTAFGLALILIFVVYKGNKKNQLINKILKKQKEEITQKNEENKMLLKEIHHRVKNNLQVVNNLLKLQSREVEDEKVVEMFKEAQKRVLSMAKLHEKMYGLDNLQFIDVQEHFKLLAQDLVKSYAVGKHIGLDLNVEDVKLKIRTLVPLGLIINELITNSLKYAFEGRDQGKIIIGLKNLKDEKYELIIGDNGKGFRAKASSGLGTKLIKLFVRQLNGSMEQLDQNGTVFRIVFENLDKDF